MRKFNVDIDIKFQLIEKKSKTYVWNVFNTFSNSFLGVIKWFPAWRHYVFFPEADIIFSDSCLIRIGNFIAEQNSKHRRFYDRMG